NAGTLAAGVTNALGSTSSITVANGATLLLSGVGGNDRINNNAAINLNGGATFNTGGLNEGVVPHSPCSAGKGTLALSGSSPSVHITIDFGTMPSDPGSALAFSDLVGGAGAYVDILNWTGDAQVDSGSVNNDRLLFANDPGLSNADLVHFNLYSDG